MEKIATYYGTKRIIKDKSSPLTPTTFSLIHFIIILQSTPRRSMWSLFMKFPHRNLAIHFSHIGATCFLPLHLLIFVSPKSIWWGIQIQLLAVQFFTASFYLPRLRCCIFLNTLFRFLFRKINIRINCFTDSTYLLGGCHCHEKRLVALSCFVRPSFLQSVCMHLSCRFPLDGIVWQLTFSIFVKIYRGNQCVVKIRQKCWEIYMKT